MGENFKVLERECQVFGNKRSGSCHKYGFIRKEYGQKERLFQTVCWDSLHYINF